MFHIRQLIDLLTNSTKTRISFRIESLVSLTVDYLYPNSIWRLVLLTNKGIGYEFRIRNVMCNII